MVKAPRWETNQRRPARCAAALPGRGPRRGAADGGTSTAREDGGTGAAGGAAGGP